jgi:hypothetical protein
VDESGGLLRGKLLKVGIVCDHLGVLRNARARQGERRAAFNVFELTAVTASEYLRH